MKSIRQYDNEELREAVMREITGGALADDVGRLCEVMAARKFRIELDFTEHDFRVKFRRTRGRGAGGARGTFANRVRLTREAALRAVRSAGE